MNSKKVIWMINEYNGPNAGKRTRQIVLAQYLMENGYEVYIVAGSADYKGGKNYLSKEEPCRIEEFDGVNFFTIRTEDYRRNYERVLVALQFQNRLWKLRNKIPKPDVIVSDFAGLFGNVVLKWKNKYGTKIIFDILDLWPELFVDLGYLKRNSLITKVLYSMEHKSYKNADGIVFSFQGGRDYIIDKGWSIETGGDVDTSNIGYLNNGVDLLTVDHQATEYVFSDSDLDSDKFKAVYLGSVSEFNGLDILVQAAEILQERNINNVMILVYGNGNQEDRLRKLAKEKKLSNIKFKGKVEKKYAMNILGRGDINIFTFAKTSLLKYGTSPNKLFMYLASGKPILSLIKPAYDLVTSEQCGISVENEPCTIADSLIEFSRINKEDYDKYCQNSRKTAFQYDYKKLIHVLIDQIEK